MCLLMWHNNPDAKSDECCLILASVRDELYTRPTKHAHFWGNPKQVVSGLDMEPGKEGGTWLAMSKTGKIGVLLNILQPDEELLPGKKGRGFLVVDYVDDEKDYFSYLKDLSSVGDDYNEFCLVTMDYSSLKEPKMACYNNHMPGSTPVLLKPGTHVFGNSIDPLEVSWPKAEEAKVKFSSIIKEKGSLPKNVLTEELFSLLQDRTQYPVDNCMKKQGKGKSNEFMQKLSAIFVAIPEANYGSRCHTVITIDGAGNVDYVERSRLSSELNDPWHVEHHTFQITTE